MQPDSPELEKLYQEGRAAYLSEDYQTAAAIFERVVKSDPTHIKALINWGVSLSRDGDPKEALPKFEQALARDPNHAWAMYNLGVALQRLGEHEAAMIQYKQAVERDPALLTPEMKHYFEDEASNSKRTQSIYESHPRLRHRASHSHFLGSIPSYLSTPTFKTGIIISKARLSALKELNKDLSYIV